MTRCSQFNPVPAALRWLAGLLLVCGWSTGSSGRAAEADLEAITLQLKWKHQFQFAGYYAAIEQGYYREAGLEVTLREAETGMESAREVLAGRAEYGIATSDLVLLRNQGQPVVVISSIFQHSPLVFLVMEDSGVTSIHSLKGRQIMLESHAEELIAYLKYEGIERGEYQVVPHSFDPGALIRGEVAAISAYDTDEPFLLKDEGLRYLTFTPRAAGIDFYGDSLFTTEDEVRQRPERVRRFLRATHQGWAYALDHPEELVDLIREKYSDRHSREHLLWEAEKTRRLILPDVVEIGYINPGRWRHIADTYTSLGMLPPDTSLEGLLFQVEEPPNYTGFWIALAVALVIIGILVAAIVRYLRMNAKISSQAQAIEKAMSEIKVLRGIIPICSHCKKVRDDDGYWRQVESYISTRTDARFSHGICTDCVDLLYPEFSDKVPKPPAKPGKRPGEL